MEIDSETMMAPGDVVIDDIVIRSYTGFNISLKGVFQNFTIYEDMFSNYMTGSITILDSMNIVKHFPIIGAETLIISYRTPYRGSPMVRLAFRTFKISVRSATAQPNSQMVRIEFVSHQAIKSMQTKISKSFKAMTVDEMVVSIFDEHLALTKSEWMGGISKPRTFQEAIDSGYYGIRSRMQSVGDEVTGTIIGIGEDRLDGGILRMASVEPTFDVRSYVIPYWSPLYTINWLCHRARARSNTSMCDYVMFENSDGHHFVPISLLKTRDTRYTYTDYQKGFRNQSGDRMLISELRNMLSYRIEDSTDKVRQQMLGMFSSAILTHDMTTKSWSSEKFNYDREFASMAHLEPNPLVPFGKTDYPRSDESHLKFYPSNTYTMEGLRTIHDSMDMVLMRQSLLAQIDSFNVVAECHGDTNVKVGQVIELVMPSVESLKRKDKFEDDYVRGRYLVTTVRHVVTDRDHKMTLTLSRDSFAEPLADFKKGELIVEN